MAFVNLKSRVGKLNDVCRSTLESAAGLCLSRTNYNVEIEHWLIKLLDAPDGDLAALFRFYEVDTGRLSRDLTKVVDKFKTGNARPPSLSPNVVDWVRHAWDAASNEFDSARVRSGHLLYALVGEESLSRVARETSGEFAKISPEALRKDFADVTAGTAEAKSAVPAGASSSGGVSGSAAAPGGGKTPSLDQFTVDLTARAKTGKIDPVLGRDAEIRQMIDILTRRRQNNPILTGEAGVGKTAVVEGLALKIAAGDVPPALRESALLTLDLGLLQAGAGIKGEFENRLRGVIDEVKASPKPILLFIDEAHTMIGAGGAAGQNDAANLLKPALARGELRTIAATTWAEYKKYFEKDPALARRFQVVKIEEPTEASATEMLRGVVATLQAHHAVRILDEAVVEAVRLSHRYITGRQLPDKAVGVLDTAAARVGMSQSATPAALEDCTRRINGMQTSIDILSRESASGSDHDTKLAELHQSKSDAEAELKKLDERWKEETKITGEIRAIRDKLEVAASDPAAALLDAEREKLREQLKIQTAKLRQLQGERPLVNICVDAQAIADVVSAWTGIPVGRMVGDEIRTVLNLDKKLSERIIGQNHALDAIARAIRTSRAKLTDPRKPIGVFLMVGTSGVGKTETALALAELLYGGEQNLTTINMSEFKEEHKVSLLMGSPPGYVGYGEGGVLTEAVRRKPYSVVLLDEMEKAHPGVQDIFYQVFDKGQMKDGEGRDIDFKNTVVIMTSNAATDLVMKLCADPETRPTPEGLAEALHPELLKTFKPAFLGRTTIVPYFPLSDDVMRKIIELQLGRVRRRVKESYNATFEYDPAVIDHIASRCKEVHTGGRNVDHILNRTLLPELSTEFLGRMAEGQGVGGVRVGVKADGGFDYTIKN